MDYWEVKFRAKSSLLASLKYFHPEFMNITKPHRIWTTVCRNPHKILKAIHQARFLTGCYMYTSCRLIQHIFGLHIHACQYWSNITTFVNLEA